MLKMNKFKVEKIEKNISDDIINMIADLHIETIDRGFLTSLGSSLLRNIYIAITTSKHAFLLGAIDNNGTVLGFVAGTTGTGKFYKEYVLKNGIKAFFIILKKIFSLSTIKRVIEIFLYPSKKETKTLPDPEILNFSISTKYQRMGLGIALFNEMCKEFQNRGIKEIRIVTGEGQKSAHSFYEKVGAVLVDSVTIHSASTSRLYVFNVNTYLNNLEMDS